MSKAEKKKRRQQKRAFPIEKELVKRREYSDREVGITHPDLSSFIRLNDNGDVEIFAAPGVGIVISALSKSISIFGDSLRMFVSEEGLRWNNYNFNYSATSYVEPALVRINPKRIHSAVNGVKYFLDRIPEIEEEEAQNALTIEPEFTFGKKASEVPKQEYVQPDDYTGLTMDQIGLIEAYSSEYSQNHIKMIIKLLKEGYTFEDAHQKALKESK